MRAAGKSVVGNQRKNNEDSIFVPGKNDIAKDVYIVADGMGGHIAGEVASKSAIEAFISNISENYENLSNNGEVFDILIDTINSANRQVYDMSIENSQYNGMGTTFTAAIVLQDKLYVTHVGDSRLYILRNDKLRQMTKDHTYVMEMVRQGKISLEEAAVHPKRNIITRAIGTYPNVDVDMIIEVLEPGDIIMICSDGLSNMVDESNITKILKRKRTPAKKVDELIDLANANGGIDNISVIVAQWEV